MTSTSSVRVHSTTEARHPGTVDIDLVSSTEIVQLINAEDRLVAGAVGRELDRIAEAVDLAVAAIRAGGRVHYFGSGTSGRLGVLDVVELYPTFNVGPEWFVAHHAGGFNAVVRAAEGAEDDFMLGSQAAAGLGRNDLAVGLAASGRTPYVRGALEAAREAGASTVLISSNPEAPLAGLADVPILVDTGPEVITGSTRMKAGTAQKLVLNSFSTATMIRLGRTYSNLMVELRATNAKLRGRKLAIVAEATGRPDEECMAALDAAAGHLPSALVSLLAGVSAHDARAALDLGGSVRAALEGLRGPGRE